MLPVTDILRAITAEGAAPEDRAGRFQQSAPPVVVWNVTNLCNMSCPHCYSAAKQHRSPDDLGPREARTVLRRLKDFGIRVLIFSGGEPLLRPDLLELIGDARALGMQCHLSTNGVLLTREICAQLSDLGVVYVGVSVDGRPLINDPYRGMEQACDNALRGLRRAREAGLETGLRITVSRRNAGELFPMLDVARAQRIPRFYVSHLVYGGRGEGFAREDLDPQESRLLMEQLFERALELIGSGDPLRIVTGGNDADGALLYRFVARNLGEAAAETTHALLSRRGGNSAGEKVLNVDHRGDVHPDQFWRRASLGNLLRASLSEILENDLITQLRKRETLLKGKCAACRFQSICRGSHRERALVAHQDVWAADPACYFQETEVSA